MSVENLTQYESFSTRILNLNSAATSDIQDLGNTVFSIKSISNPDSSKAVEFRKVISTDYDAEKHLDKYRCCIQIIGKNKFNPYSCANTTLTNFNNKDCLVYTDGAEYFSYSGDFKENTPYTFQATMYRDSENVSEACVIKADYTDGSTDTYYSFYNNVNSSFTTDSNKTLARIRGNWNNEHKVYIDIDTLQLEEGATKTECYAYNEYVENIYLDAPLTNATPITFKNNDVYLGTKLLKTTNNLFFIENFSSININSTFKPNIEIVYPKVEVYSRTLEHSEFKDETLILENTNTKIVDPDFDIEVDRVYGKTYTNLLTDYKAADYLKPNENSEYTASKFVIANHVESNAYIEEIQGNTVGLGIENEDGEYKTELLISAAEEDMSGRDNTIATFSPGKALITSLEGNTIYNQIDLEGPVNSAVPIPFSNGECYGSNTLAGQTVLTGIQGNTVLNAVQNGNVEKVITAGNSTTFTNELTKDSTIAFSGYLDEVEGRTYQNITKNGQESNVTTLEFSQTLSKSGVLTSPPSQVAIKEIQGNTIQGFENVVTNQMIVDKAATLGLTTVSYALDSDGYITMSSWGPNETVKPTENSIIQLEASTKYSCIIYDKTHNYIGYNYTYIYDLSGAMIASSSATNITFTTPSDGKVCILPTNHQATPLTMIIVKGEYDLSQYPWNYNLSYIESIGDAFVDTDGVTKYKVTVENTNKNLAKSFYSTSYDSTNIQVWTNVVMIASLKDGIYTLKQDVAGNNVTPLVDILHPKVYSKLDNTECIMFAGVTYTISFDYSSVSTNTTNFLLLDKQGAQIKTIVVCGSGTISGGFTTTITPSVDVYGIATRMNYGGSYVFSFQMSNFMIEVSSSKTAFELPTSNKQELILPQPLRSLGSVRDRIYLFNGKYYLEKNINTIPLKDIAFSKDTWQDYVSINGVEVCSRYDFNKPSDDYYCSEYGNSNYCVTGFANKIYSYYRPKFIKTLDGYNNLSVSFPIKDGILTVAQAQQYMSDNNVLLYYRKATPEIIELNMSKPILNTYNTNNITINKKIPYSTTLINNLISYETLSLLPSTQYLVKIDKTDGELNFDLGGTRLTSSDKQVSITTPATIVENSIKLYGNGITVSNIQVFEKETNILSKNYVTGIESVGIEDKKTYTSDFIKMNELRYNMKLVEILGDTWQDTNSKNLFDINTFTTTTIIANGSFSVSGSAILITNTTGDNAYKLNEFINIKSKQTVYVYSEVTYTNINLSGLNSITRFGIGMSNTVWYDGGFIGYTPTTASGTVVLNGSITNNQSYDCFLYLCGSRNGSMGGSIKFDKLMISSQPIQNYEPYHKIDLSNIQHLGELYTNNNGDPVLDELNRKQYKFEIRSFDYSYQNQLLNPNLNTDPFFNTTVEDEWNVFRWNIGDYKLASKAVVASSEYKNSDKIYIRFDVIKLSSAYYNENLWCGRTGGYDAVFFDGNFYNLLPVNQQTTASTITMHSPPDYDPRTFVLSFGAYSRNLECNFKIKNCIVINLTKFYGKGNEPTKEWCDSHIYFSNNNDIIYEPSNNKIILLPYQLMKIGDVKDKLYWDSNKNKYVIEKYIKTTNLPTFGTINSTLISSTTGCRYMNTYSASVWNEKFNGIGLQGATYWESRYHALDKPMMVVPGTNLQSLYSNTYLNGSIKTGKILSISNQGITSVQIMFRDTECTDVNQMNEWVKTFEGREVYYTLLTPELIETNMLMPMTIEMSSDASYIKLKKNSNLINAIMKLESTNYNVNIKNVSSNSTVFSESTIPLPQPLRAIDNYKDRLYYDPEKKKYCIDQKIKTYTPNSGEWSLYTYNSNVRPKVTVIDSFNYDMAYDKVYSNIDISRNFFLDSNIKEKVNVYLYGSYYRCMLTALKSNLSSDTLEGVKSYFKDFKLFYVSKEVQTIELISPTHYPMSVYNGSNNITTSNLNVYPSKVLMAEEIARYKFNNTQSSNWLVCNVKGTGATYQAGDKTGSLLESSANNYSTITKQLGTITSDDGYIYFKGNGSITDVMITDCDPTANLNFNYYYYFKNSKSIGDLQVNGTYSTNVISKDANNLYDGAVVASSLINTDGSITNSAAWCCSLNYLRVQPNSTMYCSKGDSGTGTTTVYLCYYDINKNFIIRNAVNSSNTSNQSFVVPANAYYLKVSIPVSICNLLYVGSVSTLINPKTNVVKLNNSTVFSKDQLISINPTYMPTYLGNTIIKIADSIKAKAVTTTAYTQVVDNLKPSTTYTIQFSCNKALAESELKLKLGGTSLMIPYTEIKTFNNITITTSSTVVVTNTNCLEIQGYNHAISNVMVMEGTMPKTTYHKGIKSAFQDSNDIEFTGNRLSLLNKNYNGIVDIKKIEGNTVVNYCVNENRELYLNNDIDLTGVAVTVTDGIENGLVDVVCEGNTITNLWKCNGTNYGSDKTFSYIDNVNNEIVWDFSKGQNYNNWIQIGNKLKIIKPNTTYTIFYNILQNNMTLNGTKVNYSVGGNLWAYRCSTTDISFSPTDIGWKKKVFTTSEIESNTNNMIGWVINSKDSAGNVLIDGGKVRVSTKIFVLEGDYTNRFIPKIYHEGMKSVGQNEVGDNQIEIKSLNNNLFNYEEYYKYFPSTKTADESILSHIGDLKGGNHNYSFASPMNVDLKPNTSYTLCLFNLNDSGQVLNFEGCLSTENAELGTTVQIGTIGYKLFTTNDTNYRNGISFKINTSTNGAPAKYKIMIVEGNVKPSTYTHYNSTKINHLLTEPLRGLYNGAKDKFVKINNKWLIERNWGKIILNGSENWVLMVGNWLGDNTFGFKVSFPKMINNRNIETIYSDVFPAYSGLSLSTNALPNDVEMIGNDSSELGLRILKSKLTTQDLAGFKGWLAANPVTVIYQLKEPTYELLNISSELTTRSNTMNIFNNSIIPCNMIVKNTGYNALIKPSTVYTIVSDSNISGTLGINLGGLKITSTTSKFKLTTPAILTDNMLRPYGKGLKVSSFQLLVGDYTNVDYPKFNGMKSSFDNTLITQDMVDNGSEAAENIGKYKFYIQLEEGTTVTDYEPYNVSSKALYLSKPLLKGDELVIKNDGLYHYHKRNKIVLTGNEIWANGGTNGNKTMTFRYRTSIANNYDYPNSNNTIILNDKFITITPSNVWGNNSYDEEGIGLGTGKGDGIDIRISKSKLTTQDATGFKAWLQINPLTVIYELAVPYYEKISDEKISLKASPGFNINMNSDMPVSKTIINVNISLTTNNDRIFISTDPLRAIGSYKDRLYIENGKVIIERKIRKLKWSDTNGTLTNGHLISLEPVDRNFNINSGNLFITNLRKVASQDVITKAGDWYNYAWVSYSGKAELDNIENAKEWLDSQEILMVYGTPIIEDTGLRVNSSLLLDYDSNGITKDTTIPSYSAIKLLDNVKQLIISLPQKLSSNDTLKWDIADKKYKIKTNESYIDTNITTPYSISTTENRLIAQYTNAAAPSKTKLSNLNRVVKCKLKAGENYTVVFDIENPTGNIEVNLGGIVLTKPATSKMTFYATSVTKDDLIICGSNTSKVSNIMIFENNVVDSLDYFDGVKSSGYYNGQTYNYEVCVYSDRKLVTNVSNLNNLSNI